MSFINVTTPPALSARNVGTAILGTATSNAAIDVLKDGVQYATIPANQNDGNWSYTPPEPGTYNFLLVVPDPAPISFAVTVSAVVNNPPTLANLALNIGLQIIGTCNAFGTILVYKSDVLIDNSIQTYGNNNSFQYTPTEVGSYKFALQNSNGISEKSSEVLVSAQSACELYNDQPIAVWSSNANAPFNAFTFDNGAKFYLLRVISRNPLTLEPRAKNCIQRSDFIAQNGIVKSEILGCLSGKILQNELDLDDTLLLSPPVGFVRQDGLIVQLATASRRLRANMTNLCNTTANNIQVGVTNHYADSQPNVGQVVAWTDGLEYDANVIDGKYPWIFTRKKNEPTNVSAPTKTLLT